MFPWWVAAVVFVLGMASVVWLDGDASAQGRACPTCGRHICSSTCRHGGAHIVQCLACDVEVSHRTLEQLADDVDAAG